MDYKSVQPGVKKGTNPHHFFLGGFTALALLVIYISINTPSASTENLSTSNTRSGSDPVLPSTIAPPSKPRVEKTFKQPNTGDAIGKVADSTRVQSGVAAVSPGIVENKNKETNDVDIVLASYTLPENTGLGTGPTNVVVRGVRKTEPVGDTTAQEIVQPVVEQIKPDPIDLFLESRDWIISKVKQGDTLSQIFSRNDLAVREAYAIAKIEDAILSALEISEAVFTPILLKNRYTLA